MTADRPFTCPCCGATSCHPQDVEHRYCSACHWWTGDPELGPPHVEAPCEAREKGMAAMSELSTAELAALEDATTAYRAAMAVLARVRWRWGRREGVHLYAQLGPEPSDDDPVLGTLFTEELAAEACAAHNADLIRRKAGEAP